MSSTYTTHRFQAKPTKHPHSLTWRAPRTEKLATTAKPASAAKSMQDWTKGTHKIYFRFSYEKDLSLICFEERKSLTVFEVKNAILILRSCTDCTGFDLEISNPDTDEVYDEDLDEIRCWTTVKAVRKPAAQPGMGKAERYLMGKMPTKRKWRPLSEREIQEIMQAKYESQDRWRGMTDEQKLRAANDYEELEWKLRHDNAMYERKMALKTKREEDTKNGIVSKPKPPPPSMPPNYICFRCGQRNHFISDCPTNGDPTYDNRPRLRRAIGIPKTQLQKVDISHCMTPDGGIDFDLLDSNVLYTADGDFAVQVPDHKAWEKYAEGQRQSAALAKKEEEEKEMLRGKGMICPLENHIFDHAAKTSCCGYVACRNCLEQYLVDFSFHCPGCDEKQLMEDLKPDEDMIKRVTNHKAEKDAALMALRDPPQTETKTSTPESSKKNEYSEETTSPPSDTNPRKRKSSDDNDDDSSNDEEPPTKKRVYESAIKPLPLIKNNPLLWSLKSGMNPFMISPVKVRLPLPPSKENVPPKEPEPPQEKLSKFALSCYTPPTKEQKEEAARKHRERVAASMPQYMTVPMTMLTPMMAQMMHMTVLNDLKAAGMDVTQFPCLVAGMFDGSAGGMTFDEETMKKKGQESRDESQG
ncbi:hypothetical protein K470DRAFT_296005 [Piedraia hortae CBS 480.64]|uniref:DWNN-domain-containing protein n=1 Tax=Piedraia hortae CBS 480.64 TaxID=1314780 RepID=A0A6A7BUJ2_9PEZI|nr:hypothetical protein K470DRAFT_296005 [Piedraia hortae CBS 480.64]